MAESDPTPTPAPAWHAELADWPSLQARGWDKLDAPTAAAAIAKSYRELQQLHGGLAAGDVVPLPKAGDAEAAKAFWARLGAPAAPDGYKFDDIKFSDGTSVDQAFADQLRSAAAATHMPASMFDSFVRQMLPHMEQAEANERVSQQAAAQASRQALEAEWGPNILRNKFIASRAMEALGLPAEAVAALEGLPGVGYQGVMNMMLKLGEQMGEARFVSSGTASATALTRDQARAQLAALGRDENWVKRWASGGVAEAKQKSDLTAIIAGGGP